MREGTFLTTRHAAPLGLRRHRARTGPNAGAARRTPRCPTDGMGGPLRLGRDAAPPCGQQLPGGFGEAS